MTLFVSNVPFVAVDLTTKGVVADLVDQCDGRAACTPQELSETICAVLGMRGLGPFKFNKSDKTPGQKAAIEQIKRHLHSELIIGAKGKDCYEVTKNIRLKPTMVRPSVPNVFQFRVTGEYANYPSVEGIPCAEAVSLISGNRACKLVMPEVATTFQYLLYDEPLPSRIGRLEPLGDLAGAKQLTSEYRAVVHKELTRAGYMGLLVPDNNTEALSFVVTSQYSSKFPTFLEQATRPWFRENKLDLVKFYTEITDRFGGNATITGVPTTQVLRDQAGIGAVT